MLMYNVYCHQNPSTFDNGMDALGKETAMDIKGGGIQDPSTGLLLVNVVPMPEFVLHYDCLPLT